MKGVQSKAEDGEDVITQKEPCDCNLSKIKLPKSFMLVGGSQSGKTWLVKDLMQVRKHIFDPPPREIIFCYTAWQKIYDELQGELQDTITFRTDIPSKQELLDMYEKDPGHRILILDDKMTVLRDSPEGRNVVEIVTIVAHHCCFSCFVLTQNLFHSSIQREISLNCQYLVLFRNSRSYQQIRTLGSQLMKGQLDYFVDAYEKATTNRKFGYLWIDLCPETNPKYKLKSCILPGDDLLVYLPLK